MLLLPLHAALGITPTQPRVPMVRYQATCVLVELDCREVHPMAAKSDSVNLLKESLLIQELLF